MSILNIRYQDKESTAADSVPQKRINPPIASETSYAELAHRQLERQATLAQLKLAISRPVELANLLDEITKAVVKHLPASDSSIILRDAASGEFRTSAATVTGQKRDETAHRVRRTGGATRWIVENRQPIIIEDVAQDPFGANRMLEQYGYSAYCGVPLIVEGRAIGVLYALNNEVSRYPADSVNFLTTLANHAAIAVENVDLFEKLRRNLAVTESLNKIASTSTNSGTSVLMQTIVDTTREVCQADYVSCTLWNAASADIGKRVSSGSVGGMTDYVSIADYEDGLHGWAIRSLQPLLSVKDRPDERETMDLRQKRLESQAGSIMVAPLIHNEIVFGTLTAINKVESANFQETQLDVLKMMAAQASVTINSNLLHLRVRRQATDLEREVQSQTMELKAANVRLQEADQLKNKFIADISHELRTPLTNLSLYMDLLQNGKAENRARYWQTLQREKDRLISLVETILQVAAIDKVAGAAGAQGDLIKVVEQTLPAFAAQLEQKSLQLETSLCTAVPAVRLSDENLRRLFTQLLKNAIGFSQQGTILVSVGRVAEAGTICLIIQDEGVGIPEQEMPYIFDKFYRGRVVSQLNKAAGSGLGLAIVKSLTTQAGGQIEVASKPGEGSTFKVFLPAAGD